MEHAELYIRYMVLLSFVRELCESKDKKLRAMALEALNQMEGKKDDIVH